MPEVSGCLQGSPAAGAPSTEAASRRGRAGCRPRVPSAVGRRGGAGWWLPGARGRSRRPGRPRHGGLRAEAPEEKAGNRASATAALCVHTRPGCSRAKVAETHPAPAP